MTTPTPDQALRGAGIELLEWQRVVLEAMLRGSPPPPPPARVLVCHTHEQARAYVALHPSLRDHYVVTPRSPERVRGLLIGEYVVAYDDPSLARWAGVHLLQGRASLGPLRLARRPAPEHAPADRA